MVRINLLPWRDEERANRLNEFYAMLVAGVIVALLISIAMHIVVAGWIENQQARNTYLSNLIAELDKAIKTIEELKEKKTELTNRMKTITALQESRPEIVHLFDELVNTTPDGVYITRLVQKGRSLIIEGRAQSETRVSAYMRNINQSQWIEAADLQVVEQRGGGKKTGQEEYRSFVLKAQQVDKNKGKAEDSSKPAKNKNKAQR